MSHKRPLSPHLQIYRFPITAIVSILHRVSGIFLSAFVAVVFPVYLIVLVYAPQWLTQWASIHQTWWSVCIQLAVSLAVFYHILSGLRHFLMDLGYLLGWKNSRRSAYTVLISTVVSAILFQLI